MFVGQNLRYEVGSVTYTSTGGSSTSNNIATIVGSTVAGVVAVLIIVIVPIIFIVVFFMRRLKATATQYTNRLAQIQLKETDGRIRGTLSESR